MLYSLSLMSVDICKVIMAHSCIIFTIIYLKHLYCATEIYHVSMVNVIENVNSVYDC